MRQIRAYAVLAIAVAMLAACGGGDPDVSPATTQPTAPAVTPSDATLSVTPLKDCTAMASIVSQSVGITMKTDNLVSDPPDPPDAYENACNLLGPSAADPALILQLQVRMTRPRVDPYENKPMATWLAEKPKELAVSTLSQCTTKKWNGAPNGYRCDSQQDLMIAAVAADKGTAIQILAAAHKQKGSTATDSSAFDALDEATGKAMTALIGWS